MFRIAVGLFLLGVIAAIFGAGSLAGIFMEGAELFLVVGLVLAVVALIFGRR